MRLYSRAKQSAQEEGKQRGQVLASFWDGVGRRVRLAGGLRRAGRSRQRSSCPRASARRRTRAPWAPAQGRRAPAGPAAAAPHHAGAAAPAGAGMPPRHRRSAACACGRQRRRQGGKRRSRGLRGSARGGGSCTRRDGGDKEGDAQRRWRSAERKQAQRQQQAASSSVSHSPSVGGGQQGRVVCGAAVPAGHGAAPLLCQPAEGGGPGDGLQAGAAAGRVEGDGGSVTTGALAGGQGLLLAERLAGGARKGAGGHGRAAVQLQRKGLAPAGPVRADGGRARARLPRDSRQGLALVAGAKGPAAAGGVAGWGRHGELVTQGTAEGQGLAGLCGGEGRQRRSGKRQVTVGPVPARASGCPNLAQYLARRRLPPRLCARAGTSKLVLAQLSVWRGGRSL